ncbi:ATP-binding protein [Methanoregula sp.]|uniref:sensor histidine kinase n=1 Tax=Methanoregula sp. TaxID=2052170 RepID=UPI00236D5E80|nr:ATP-binding protein [Methanoregula sp.]MDD1685482.1 ATP-binding protein [Methanoregula sp.]
MSCSYSKRARSRTTAKICQAWKSGSADTVTEYPSGNNEAALRYSPVRGEEDHISGAGFTDPLLIKVSYNLFDNARQHGGTVTRISVSHRPAGTGLVISVADDGAGISREDKTHLFERGFGKNTGLELFLSREILSITGITISETGIPGEGARFAIAVPEGIFRR